MKANFKKLKSGYGLEHVVKAKFIREVGLGRLSEPHVHARTHTLTATESAGLSTEWYPRKQEFRLIHHLSYPHGDSVNNTINPAISTVK